MEKLNKMLETIDNDEVPKMEDIQDCPGKQFYNCFSGKEEFLSCLEKNLQKDDWGFPATLFFQGVKTALTKFSNVQLEFDQDAVKGYETGGETRMYLHGTYFSGADAYGMSKSLDVGGYILYEQYESDTSLHTIYYLIAICQGKESASFGSYEPWSAKYAIVTGVAQEVPTDKRKEKL